MPQTLQSPRTDQIDEETILRRYDSLPDDLKEALMGVSTADAIYEVGRKANLNVEKIGSLAEEIGLIILGFVPSENFISDLKRVLEVDEEKASSIAAEVNDRIFLPIRESLKRIHGAAWAEGITRAPLRAVGPVVVPRSPEATGIPVQSIGTERKPAPPIAEIKPEVIAKPLVKAEEKIPPAPLRPPPPPTPKEPLLIRPMGVPGAPITKEPLVKVMQQPTALPPTPQSIPRIPAPAAAERQVSPPAPAVKPPEKAAPPPPAGGLTAEKKPFEIRPPGLPYQPPKPPEIKAPAPPIGGPAARPATPPLPEVKFPPPPPAPPAPEWRGSPNEFGRPPVKPLQPPAPKPVQPPPPPVSKTFETIKVPPPPKLPVEEKPGPAQPKPKIQVPPPPPRQAGLDPYRESLE